MFQIFESLNSCPVVDESTSLIDTLDFVNRPRQVKTMHLASATSFLRFTRAHPIRMMVSSVLLLQNDLIV